MDGGTAKLKFTKEFIQSIFCVEEDDMSDEKPKKKCKRPDCSAGSTTVTPLPIGSNVYVAGQEVNPDGIEHMQLRAKCLELALVTNGMRYEDDALKWAKRYWEFVRRGE